jgi:hypothetical protein
MWLKGIYLNVKKLVKSKKFGFGLFIASSILWLLLAVVPFLPIYGKYLAITLTIIFIAAEVTFYLSIIILGKTFYNKLKSMMNIKNLMKKKEE